MCDITNKEFDNDVVEWELEVPQPPVVIKKYLMTFATDIDGVHKELTTKFDLREAGYVHKSEVEKLVVAREEDKKIYDSVIATYDAVFMKKVELEKENDRLLAEISSLRHEYEELIDTRLTNRWTTLWNNAESTHPEKKQSSKKCRPTICCTGAAVSKKRKR